MENIEVFKKYVDNFDIKDKDIFLKYHHSIRTSFLCGEIAKRIKLKEDDIELAKTIGLLHDIGRFYQLEKYDSYSDLNMDHGDYGVKVLFKDKKIKNYYVDEQDYKTIELAIANHNKYKIDEKIKGRDLLFCKLIRDCDKLEILYRLSTADFIIKEDDSDISESVKQQFYNEESINNANIKVNNDKIVSMLGFIYDLNFEESIIYLKEEEILDKIYETIKNKNKFDEYFNKIKEKIC